MIVWIIGGISTIVGLVIVARVIGEVKHHIAYYLPPIAVAELAKELNAEVALVRTHSEALKQQVANLITVMEQTGQFSNTLDLLREEYASNVAIIANEWLRRHGREVFNDIIRNASLRVANNVEMGLVEASTGAMGRYVILQSLENLSLEVDLQAEYLDPERMREAIVRLIKWHPLRSKPPKSDEELARWFIEQTANRRELDLFLGRLGEDLLQLQWKGKLALSVKREVPSTPVPESLKNSVRPA